MFLVLGLILLAFAFIIFITVPSNIDDPDKIMNLDENNSQSDLDESQEINYSKLFLDRVIQLL